MRTLGAMIAGYQDARGSRGSDFLEPGDRDSGRDDYDATAAEAALLHELEDGHVRPLARMQHQVAHLFAARQASHLGKHEPDLDQRVVPQARTCRERALTPQHVVPKLVHRAQRLIPAALAGRLLVTSTTLTPVYMTDGKEESTNGARCEGTV